MFLEIIVLTLFIELITIIGRMIFGNVKEKYNSITFKYKFRVHHGELGIVIIILNYLFFYSEIGYLLGWTLFLSDAIHHFIVLPIWVGRTEYR